MESIKGGGELKDGHKGSLTQDERGCRHLIAKASENDTPKKALTQGRTK